ncbi:MAG TPA: RidA family protein [Gemmatimonadaceae bacterium]|nr:RidA family protein [Gemmatimonadaceae bacterium]
MRIRLLAVAALFVLASALPAQQQQGANKQVINRPDARPGSVLSSAVRVGDVIFLSGVMGTKQGGVLADGGIEGQTRQALENVKSALALAGASMTDVAKCTVFLTDAANFQAMNRVYHEFFPTDPPARSTVAVAALVVPNALLEIECTAAAPKK